MNLDHLLRYAEESKKVITATYLGNLTSVNKIKFNNKLFKDFLRINKVIKKMIIDLKNVESNDLNHDSLLEIMLDIRKAIHYVNYCYNRYLIYNEYYDNDQIEQLKILVTVLKDEVAGLQLTQEDIDNYFFDEDCYFTVRDKIKYFNTDDLSYFGLFGDDDNYGIVVPRVHDLQSALVNIHEIRHALDVMTSVDTTVDEFEKDAVDEEYLFLKNYVHKGLYKKNK